MVNRQLLRRKKTCPGESATRRVDRGPAPSCARVRARPRLRLKPRATAAKPRWGCPLWWLLRSLSAGQRPEGQRSEVSRSEASGQWAEASGSVGQWAVVNRQLLHRKTCPGESATRRVARPHIMRPRARLTCTRRPPSPAAKASGYHCKAPLGLSPQAAAAQPVRGQ